MKEEIRRGDVVSPPSLRSIHSVTLSGHFSIMMHPSLSTYPPTADCRGDRKKPQSHVSRVDRRTTRAFGARTLRSYVSLRRSPNENVSTRDICLCGC